MLLWEILVPASWNDGSEITVEHHNEWDRRVKALAGGLTILRSARGIWQAPDGTEFKEKMIPVRVACSQHVLDTIIDITLHHYDQEAVMACLVSDHVIIRHRAQAA